jgi:hypothetical protein
LGSAVCSGFSTWDVKVCIERNRNGGAATNIGGMSEVQFVQLLSGHLGRLHSGKKKHLVGRRCGTSKELAKEFTKAFDMAPATVDLESSWFVVASRLVFDVERWTVRRKEGSKMLSVTKSVCVTGVLI